MPGGKVHSAATVFLAVGVGYMAYRNGVGLETTTALTGGTLAGLLLTPDLDVNGGSISNHHARRAFGGIVGFIWSLIWFPYASLISHRSFFSHFPVVGTAIRVLYLLFWVGLIAGVLGLAGAVPMPPVLPWWAGWAFIGLALADMLHWAMDNTFKN